MAKALAFIMMLMTAILLNALVVGIVSSIVYGISYLVGFAFGIWHLTWLQSFAVGVVIWLLEISKK